MTAVPSLTYSELFTPAASGVGSANPLAPDAGTWMAIMLQVAASVGLPTTSWQSGGPELSILQADAIANAQEDANISLMNQGGFLDFAASGSVTYVNTNGQTVVQPVTPDPSIPSQNPTGAAGWLDVLGASVYGIQRLQASYAKNNQAIANTTGGSIGPFAAGTYHIANPTTGATYANVASLTIPSSQIAGTGGVVTAAAGTSLVTVTTQSAHGLATGNTVYISGLQGIAISQLFATVIVTGSTTFQLVGVTATGAWTSGGTVHLCTVAEFQADAIGPNSTSPPYAISETITQNTGVVTGNTVSFVGNPWESNTAYANRCRLSLASRSPNGAANAYVYFALSAAALLAAQTPPITLDGGAITKAQSAANPQTGIETVIVANLNPASTTLGAPVVEGAVNLAVVGAVSNGGLIQLQVGTTMGLATNDFATVSGVLGTIEANGTWQFNVDDATHITLQGSTFTNAYTGGGTIEAGDLGQVDNLLQQNCTPDDTILNTQSATAFPIAIAATVAIPAAQAANYTAAAQLAIAAYVAAIPIGGTVIPPSAMGVVEYSAINGLLFAAGIVGANPSYVKGISSLTIDGGSGPVSTDVDYPSATANGVLASFTLTLVKV